MRYVTSHERHGFEKGGVQQGIEQGLQQGMQQGLQQGRDIAHIEQSRVDLLEVLQTRFATIPGETVMALDTIKYPSVLTALLKQAVLANSMEDFDRALRKKIAALEQTS